MFTYSPLALPKLCSLNLSILFFLNNNDFIQIARNNLYSSGVRILAKNLKYLPLLTKLGLGTYLFIFIH